MAAQFRLYRLILFCLCALFVPSLSFAQAPTDSLFADTHFSAKENLLPTSLLVAGSVLVAFPDFNHKLSADFPETHIKVDDYLQYSPMLGMYIADIAGVKAKNSVWNQTKYLAFSQLTCAVVAQTLKYTVREQRPNAGARNSFPSGHTSVAFVGATVLYHEFKETNKPIAYSGFVVATAIGALRVTNRKHWVSDVLAGAGIGILSTNLIYYLEPFKNWQPFSKSDKIAFSPYYDANSAGLSLALKL
ncbi:phospholipid phosphatase [Bacteroidia bacterium]|nr:phospholipid phosphatase [Bacteroidia bacterium]